MPSLHLIVNLHRSSRAAAQSTTCALRTKENAVMLKLYIPIVPATVVAIKEYLWAELPSVKSSHRLEAIARGLGFKTYAALLQATQSIVPTMVKPKTAPF